MAPIACLLLFFFFGSQRFLKANPKPGDVFREYHLTGGGGNGYQDMKWADEFVFISHHTGEKSTRGNRVIEDVDLKNAVRAEIVVSHWGGHIGSQFRRIVFNNNSPVNLPLIKNTTGKPECYFSQQSQAPCEIPLEYLFHGDNEFRLEVDNQICYSFNWGWFWTNQVVLRVYYDSKEMNYPYGYIESPLANDTVSGFSKISCKIEKGSIERVEFVGHYTDFSWGGSGEFTNWHGIFWMKDTRLQRHIGTTSGLYPYLNWDCRWIPDQENMAISARLIDSSGLIYMTEAVENISLAHHAREVKMYSSADVPENFATQTDSAICTIIIPDKLNNAFLAKLVMSTFSGGTLDREVYINDVLIAKGGWGLWHRLDFCEEYVPVGALKTGANEFKIKADYPGEHAFEINWPGPVLFIEFNK